MHSLKTSCVGQIYALAKPHDSGGKRTRNRIPKEERKTLVESFIKKHQRLNNGSFPSLSLTHKEVGGSFYTIREIVREIIQENRVLGTSDGKRDDRLQDQAVSRRSTVLMDPVSPLSLSPDGLHSPSDQSHYNLSSETKSPVNGDCINGSKVGLEEKGSDILKDSEVSSTDISRSRSDFAVSCGDEHDIKLDGGMHDSVKTICDSFDVKPQEDKEVEEDNKDIGFKEIPFIESGEKNHLNNDEAKMVNVTKDSSGTIDMLPAETVVETFSVASVTSTVESSDAQPSEPANVCEAENGTEAKVENDRNTESYVDHGEISSPTPIVPEEHGTEAIVGHLPNHISVAIEKKVEEKAANPASVGAVIGNSHETKEFSNGSLTTEPTMPTTSDTESGSCKNDIARKELTIVEKATVEKGKADGSESSSSQKENIAQLNRIKPESWKGQSNVAGQDTNPLLAVLKSFLTAFVKFWSE